MEQALKMIATLLKALLAIQGFSGQVEFILHVSADRQEVRVVPKVIQ